MDLVKVLKNIPYLAVVLLCGLSQAAIADEELTLGVLQSRIDLVWIVVSMVLVFLMQAGFTLLEAGAIRAKNSINVAIKNISDLIISISAFFVFGFALMFGESVFDGFVGGSFFLLNGVHDDFDLVFFLFQAVFAGTAATICSGAVAERMGFSSYLFAALMISGLIYPISGHWVWGGALIDANDGWLAQMGFYDFAGSTVVHLLGAAVGLAAVIVLGPRIGRFNEAGEPQDLHGHNLALSAVGALILWFGWFGFNGGSELSFDEAVPGILLNTMIAPAFAGVAVYVISSFTSHGLVVDVGHLLNASLAGLVGITAGCAIVSPLGAIAIGVGSAVVYLISYRLMLAFQLDDPVSVVSVHGAAGIWGTLALAVLAPAEQLPTADNMAQLWVQFIGVAAVTLWGLVAGFLVFLCMRATGKLRVDPEHEISGLNVSEHGAKTVWLDTVKAMHHVVHEGEFGHRVPEEPGTEAGEVAQMFNKMMDKVESMMATISGSQSEMSSVAEEVLQVAATLESSIEELTEQMSELNNVAAEGGESKRQVAQATGSGEDAVVMLGGNVQAISEGMVRSSSRVGALQEQAEQIRKISSAVEEISFQVHLLGINAAIEAAVAGESGKGFGVVATEVRALAKQSKASSQEIDQICTALMDNTTKALEAVEDSVRAMDSGNLSMQTMAKSFEGISQAVKVDGQLSDRYANALAKQQSSYNRILESFTHLQQLNSRLLLCAQSEQPESESMPAVSHYGGEVATSLH